MKYGQSAILMVFFTILANAALAQELSESLARCRAVTEDAARLQCYDAVANALQGAEAQVIPADPVARADVSNAGPRDSVANTPLPPAQVVKQQHATDASGDAPISGTIIAIDVLPNGGRIVTLDNGQRWRETGTAPSLKLYVGQTVRIRPGALGSFRLFGSGNKATRVKRVD